MTTMDTWLLYYKMYYIYAQHMDGYIEMWTGIVHGTHIDTARYESHIRIINLLNQ